MSSSDPDRDDAQREDPQREDSPRDEPIRAEGAEEDRDGARRSGSSRGDGHRPHAASGRGVVHGLWSGLRELVIVVAMALLISLVVKTFLLQAFWIPSGSMENTLIEGDRVVVSKLTPGPFDLERGDVVVFDDFNGWLQGVPPPEQTGASKVVHDVLTFVGLLPTNEGEHLIKRVIGLPGDHVACCDKDGRLTINGAAINEPYVKPGDDPSLKEFDITVPPGRVWVMGDHRSDSGDSRFHDNGTGRTGSVPESAIVGRAVAIVWPPDRWTWLGNYHDAFAKVPNPSKGAGP
ncbi:MAG TPA: signal peptidase I [Segeticoccus sp.]|nr:signal peptidase I [Segeticoccus sp.]